MISFAIMSGSTHIAEFLAFRFVSGAGSFMALAAIPVRILPPLRSNDEETSADTLTVIDE